MHNSSAFGLNERTTNTIVDILSKYHDIKEVYIFGSRAKGNYKPGSDIDLAIMNQGVSPKTITSVLAAFQESSLPYTVDLVNFPALKHDDLIDHIKRVGVMFYKESSI